MNEITLVGPRIRAARRSRNLTLTDLSARTGISPSTISRLESGRREPTLTLLVPLARELRVSIDDLVSLPNDDPRVSREQLHADGISALPLSLPGSSVQVFRVRYPARMRRPKLRTHPGWEWCYTLAGTIELSLGSQRFLIEEGQAAEFDTLEPHAFRSLGGAAEAISILNADGERIHLRSAPVLD